MSDENGCDYANFQDNPEGSVHYRAVRWMACEDITTGYADHTFRKNRHATRGEVVAFLYRYTAPDFTPPPRSRFKDM